MSTATLGVAAQTFEQVFPGAKFDIVAAQTAEHWEEGNGWDTFVVDFKGLKSTVEITAQDNGSLMGTWRGDEDLTSNQGKPLRVKVAKDRILIETPEDVIGWASFIRTKLTEEALPVLVEALDPKDFCSPQVCTPGSKALRATSFLTRICGMTSDQVADHMLRSLLIGGTIKSIRWPFHWHVTPKGHWALGVKRSDERVIGAVGVRKMEDEYRIGARVTLGRLNHLFDRRAATFDIERKLVLERGTRGEGWAKREAEQFLYSCGVHTLVSAIDGYRAIEQKIQSRK